MGTISATVDDSLVKRIDDLVREQNAANPDLKLSRARMIGQLIATGFEMTVDSPVYADLKDLARITEERDALVAENRSLVERGRALEEEITVASDRYARLDRQYREVAASRETATALIEEMRTRFDEHTERIGELKADKVKAHADNDFLKSTIIPLLEAPREVYQPPAPRTVRERVAALFGGTQGT